MYETYNEILVESREEKKRRIKWLYQKLWFISRNYPLKYTVSAKPLIEKYEKNKKIQCREMKTNLLKY